MKARYFFFGIVLGVVLAGFLQRIEPTQIAAQPITPRPLLQQEATPTLGAALDANENNITDVGKLGIGANSFGTHSYFSYRDTVDDADAASEAVFRAGNVSDKRMYLRFDRGDTGAMAWKTGKNADQDWILFDAVNAAHRMVIVDGGVTDIAADGTGFVRFNGSEAGLGTGGMQVWSGGASPAAWYVLDSDDMDIFTHGIDINCSTAAAYVNCKSSFGNATINLDCKSGGDSTIFLKEGSSYRWFLRTTGGSDDFQLYSYGASKYVLAADYSTGRVGINENSPAELFCTDGGNVSIGNAAAGTNADNVLVIANGTAPASQPADAVQLYATDDVGSSELHVVDEGGNDTPLSPHDKDGTWCFRDYNSKTGVRRKVDMEKLVRLVEELTGENLMVETHEVPSGN